MRLYAGPSTHFIQDTTHNQIAEKLRTAFFDYYRRRPSDGEVQSWQNSLRATAMVFQEAELNDHGVILEYQLPLSSRRLDCIVTGHDQTGRSVVLSDAPTPTTESLETGAAFYEIWATHDTPAPIPAAESAAPTAPPLRSVATDAIKRATSARGRRRYAGSWNARRYSSAVAGDAPPPTNRRISAAATMPAATPARAMSAGIPYLTSRTWERCPVVGGRKRVKYACDRRAQGGAGAGPRPAGRRARGTSPARARRRRPARSPRWSAR